ncbi:MAG: hypothetical protein RR606_05335 [Oscillospiraceae bacterium]
MSRKPHRKPPPTKHEVALKSAGRALIAMAARENTTVEEVRKQIQIAMIAGMANQDPKVQAEWKRIPCAGEVLTPEEVIAFYAAGLAQN